jgi:hypothetical protein
VHRAAQPDQVVEHVLAQADLEVVDRRARRGLVHERSTDVEQHGIEQCLHGESFPATARVRRSRSARRREAV